ncbi:hypothetical protein BS47DRAFT_1391901 [Hydnum rufescens UP504]|uniref:Uncharacterized protein n=1 Tax=Hydnum rufescens UP504 TaxID=1448309 RepID=A0A9P6B0E2_9AGAM|nr:hypothetical protein BS47DRAFT_1391901 [Hydnum rufescens UP504]
MNAGFSEQEAVEKFDTAHARLFESLLSFRSTPDEGARRDALEQSVEQAFHGLQALAPFGCKYRDQVVVMNYVLSRAGDLLNQPPDPELGDGEPYPWTVEPNTASPEASLHCAENALRVMRDSVQEAVKLLGAIGAAIKAWDSGTFQRNLTRMAAQLDEKGAVLLTSYPPSHPRPGESMGFYLHRSIVLPAKAKVVSDILNNGGHISANITDARVVLCDDDGPVFLSLVQECYKPNLRAVEESTWVALCIQCNDVGFTSRQGQRGADSMVVDGVVRPPRAKGRQEDVMRAFLTLDPYVGEKLQRRGVSGQPESGNAVSVNPVSPLSATADRAAAFPSEEIATRYASVGIPSLQRGSFMRALMGRQTEFSKGDCKGIHAGEKPAETYCDSVRPGPVTSSSSMGCDMPHFNQAIAQIFDSPEENAYILHCAQDADTIIPWEMLDPYVAAELRQMADEFSFIQKEVQAKWIISGGDLKETRERLRSNREFLDTPEEDWEKLCAESRRRKWAAPTST